MRNHKIGYYYLVIFFYFLTFFIIGILTAKDYGMTIAAHAHGDEGMQRAIIGGVTTIEHGTLMSEETMELMKQYGTYYVPTITAGKEVAEKAKIAGFYPELVVPKALEIGPKIQETFSKAYKKFLRKK